MAIINNVNEVLHRIRAKLYPNYLHGIDGAYIARTDDEASLSIEAVCAALKNRGGFTGNYQDLVEYVRQFFDEAAYQLCDGFSVNTGYYALHPRIGGTWANEKESWDITKHPIRFSFRALKPLRDLAQHIEVHIEGVAETAGYIAEITDITTEAVNETLTPGGMFALAGHKIKVAGDSADCGVYFAPEGASAAGPSQKVKVTGHLADNTASRIVGIIPALGAGQWRVQVVTQATGSTQAFLKTPRTLEGKSVLTVA
jgi:hypothetical protein